MRLLGLAAIYQRPNTSKPAAAHKIYPYLLRGLAIERVNQVWCSDITYIPISALEGDNVVDASENMPWYAGLALLEHLETVEVAADRNLTELRFPVQWVIRPSASDYRGYAGQVASGVVRVGDEVMVLPSGLTSTIAAIDTADGPVAEAFPPMSVTLLLDDDVDISRGDMICRPNNRPRAAQDLDWAVDEVERCAGTQFDPEIAGAFCDAFAAGEISIAEPAAFAPV